MSDADWRLALHGAPLENRLVYADWLEERDMGAAALAQRLLVMGNLRADGNRWTLAMGGWPEGAVHLLVSLMNPTGMENYKFGSEDKLRIHADQLWQFECAALAVAHELALRARVEQGRKG